MRWLLFSVSGRMSRKSYAWALAFWILALGVTVSGAVNAEPDSSALAFSGLGFLLVAVVGGWSIAVMSIKRLHDAGLPGMLVIGLVVPAASFLVLPADHGLAIGQGAEPARPGAGHARLLNAMKRTEYFHFSRVQNEIG